MQIGNVSLPHGLLLAPMAGITDASFRAVCASFGAEYAVTEMISAKALWYGDRKTERLARIAPSDPPCAVPLFGSDPECLAFAANRFSDPSATPSGILPAAIDLNFGCPMPKIVNNGEGCALMKQPVLFGKIIEAVRKATSLPVTVKIRSGWDSDHKNCVEIASIAAGLGVSMIVVHGRTRSQFYAPPVDYDAISAVRQAVPDAIPVVGNGDIFTGEDAKRMMEKTDCDGIMVARGAEGNPWLFREILCRMDGVPYVPPTRKERIEVAVFHLARLGEEKGPEKAALEGRKHAAWYTKGLRNAASLRTALMQADSLEELIRLLEESSV